MLFEKKVWRGFSLSLLVKIWGAGASFLVSVVITNTLPVADAGLFFLCTAIVLVASVLSRQGFDNLLIKLIANYAREGNDSGINRVTGWAITRVLVGSVVITLVVYLASEFLATALFSKPELGAVLAVFAWSFVPASLLQIFVSMLKGRKASVLAIFFMTAALPTTLLGLLVTGEINNAEEAGFFFLLATLIVFCAVVVVWFSQFYSPSDNNVRLSEIRATSGSALTMFFYTSVLFVFIQYFTQIFVGAALSSEDVALFSISLRIAMLISFVLVAVNAVAAPRFAVYFKANQQDQLKCFARNISLLLFGVGCIALIFIQLFAEYILLIFGEHYQEAGTLLRILAVGQFVNVATGAVGVLLQMSGNEKYFLLSVTTACFVCVVGSLLLVPVYGVIAAALVTAGAVATQNLLAFWMVKHRLGFYLLGFR